MTTSRNRLVSRFALVLAGLLVCPTGLVFGLSEQEWQRLIRTIEQAQESAAGALSAGRGTAIVRLERGVPPPEQSVLRQEADDGDTEEGGAEEDGEANGVSRVTFVFLDGRLCPRSLTADQMTRHEARNPCAGRETSPGEVDTGCCACRVGRAQVPARCGP